jgi:anti-sigma factor RsiW
MNENAPLDLELHGYVDGVLDEEAMSRIEGHLRQNPEAAARVRSYLDQKTHIRRFARDGVAAESTVSFDSLGRQLAKRLKRRTLFRWRAMAAALVLFAAGWVAHVVYVPLVSGPTYANEIIQAHMLTSTDPDEVMDISPERLQKLFSRIGEMEYLPDLGTFGYQPIGAQLVPSDAGTMLHVPYRGEDGTMISYFLLHDQSEAEIPRHIVHRNGVTLAYWQHDHSRYNVAGMLPDEQLAHIASYLESAIDLY